MRSPKLILYFLPLIIVLQAHAAGNLSGFITDKKGRGLPDIDVELLDEFQRSFYNRRTKTDAAGAYHFFNLPDGIYYVKALGYKYDLEDQTQMIEIYTRNVRGGEGFGVFTLDFVLLPRKGSIEEAEAKVIFAQEVPSEARKKYEKAMEALKKRQRDVAITNLFEALQIFPNYLLALQQIGQEMFFLKKYKEAAGYFLKAIEVNPKSTFSLYYLGYSLHMLGKEYNKSALTALYEAYKMAPSSVQILYLLGKIEREKQNYQKAEEHLLKAKKLSKQTYPEIQKELVQLYANDLRKYKEAAEELELYLNSAGLTKEERMQGEKVVKDLLKKAQITSKEN
ncbi:MAG: carboxypeptidase regulatory-like domain-containing protein [Pyrinomonadaceae bacterium]|nr:carboxypeptidase regulatory-like domain-containing protein [Pyrinomonadaceae bacterium]MCX7640828.1 carboxypeptidase regulatory-like domain-containing protein [Pyrinomonadaceae bacterium]MDW8303407.1 carboxypeptidase regulatory-like domain-containing protein [Acidobacteriota bacterium]